MDKNAALAAARHEAGEMSNEEFAVFASIVEQARGGDWEGAERAVVRLQEAQRPTQEQVEQVRAMRLTST